MKCNVKDCTGEIHFTQSVEKEKKKYNKILNYFCPICGWVKMFRIEMTKQQFKVEGEKEILVYKI